MKNLDLLIPKNEAPRDTWKWATVTATDPLRIRFDGDADPLDLTPDNTAGKVKVGQRVWTQITGKRVIVVSASGGASGGDGAITGDVKMAYRLDAHEGWLLMDGSTFDETQYPELYELLGTNVLPDMTTRYPMGNGTPGVAGGSQKITVSNLPNHTHALGGSTGTVSANHTHTIPNHKHTFNVGYDSNVPTNGGGWRVYDVGNATPASNGGANGNTTNSGGGGATSGFSANHTHGLPANTGGANSAANADFWMPYLRLGFFIHA